MRGRSSIHFSNLKLASGQVALKRHSCLASRLLIQSRDIMDFVEGKSSKSQDPVRLVESMQAIVYASRPTTSWSQNRLTVVPYFCVITYLPPVIIHSFAPYPRCPCHFQLYTPLIYTLFAQRCLGICSCFRFKGIFSRFTCIPPRFPWMIPGLVPHFYFSLKAGDLSMYSNSYILSIGLQILIIILQPKQMSASGGRLFCLANESIINKSATLTVIYFIRLFGVLQ